ncbi:MAG TPA: hypothetical protein DIT97_10515 [Gimesia maris]|uniref:Uncharacterized protein n=1 Tax=Gimesia maris TaxID=122 RepID=A0A3D3R3X7_9PLAN|nr:hypothetical protein [Gimesia maris]
MSERAKLEVSIPLEAATSRLMNRKFPAHVRRLMHHLGGQNISGTSEEDGRKPGFFMDAIFSNRQTALSAAMAIRALSLGHSGTSAKDFWYTIDDDEMLLFKKSGDLYAFESKSFTEVLNEKLSDKVSESFGSFVGF